MPFVCMYMCCTFAHTTFSVGLNKKTTQLELAVRKGGIFAVTNNRRNCTHTIVCISAICIIIVCCKGAYTSTHPCHAPRQQKYAFLCPTLGQRKANTCTILYARRQMKLRTMMPPNTALVEGSITQLNPP